MDEEQYRAFLARRQIELTKRREERKAKVLAMAIAMVGGEGEILFPTNFLRKRNHQFSTEHLLNLKIC